MNTPELLMAVFHTLLKAFGPQHWWPGDTPLEVMIGAILTQNTNWTNVEKAIGNLKREGMLDLAGLKRIRPALLAELIRPSGYFNVKAKRLKAFVDWVWAEFDGDLDAMFHRNPTSLREDLLSVKGIGRETADSILLYAGQVPVFVVDAYTYRIFSRHGLVPEGADYEEIRELFEDNLPRDVTLYNEFHALIVALGKNICRRRPRCEACPAREVFGSDPMIEES